MHNVIKCPIELWPLIPQYAYCYVKTQDGIKNGFFRQWTLTDAILSTHKFKTDLGYTEFAVQIDEIIEIHKEPAENAQIELLLLYNSIKRINKTLGLD